MNNFYSLLSKKDADLDKLVEIIANKKFKSIVKKSDFTQDANTVDVVDNLIRLHDEKLAAYFHLKVTVESMMNHNADILAYFMIFLVAEICFLQFNAPWMLLLATILVSSIYLSEQYNSKKLEFIDTMLKIADDKIYKN